MSLLLCIFHQGAALNLFLQCRCSSYCYVQHNNIFVMSHIEEYEKYKMVYDKVN